MSKHSTYQPQSSFMKWLERRLPIASLGYSSFVAYPTPRNLNYWWAFGAILTFMLGVQIVTGVVLAMHYTPHVDFAFNSVEGIMRDVNYGWLLRYVHANGASFFFVAVYIHMARGMYYGSYKEPREVLWILGVILFLLMIATGFVGYVLPWGQMSFWAATVITNLFSAIPIFGDSIVTWLWGGFAVGNPTLNRFYSLHYLLPFVIVGVVMLHIWALHVVGQNNPTGVEPKSEKDTVAFTPYATIKGCLLHRRVLYSVRLVHLLHSQLSSPFRQLHACRPRPDTDAYRAGMVLPAVLRHSARHPEQAPRRDGACCIDHRARVYAVARHVAGAVGELSTTLSAVFVHLLCRRHWAWLSRLPGTDRRLRHRRANPDDLLFRVLLRHSAASGIVRKTKSLPNSISESVLRHGMPAGASVRPPTIVRS
jgi:Cytochrome b/b6/petB